jgi:hypothetical protein
MTPFDLPLPVDERPLYDRLEIGMLLKCKQSISNPVRSVRTAIQVHGRLQYIVVETDFDRAQRDPKTRKWKSRSAKNREPSRWCATVRSDPIKWTPFDGEHERRASSSKMRTKSSYEPDQNVPVPVSRSCITSLSSISRSLNLPLLDYMPKDLAQAVYLPQPWP